MKTLETSQIQQVSGVQMPHGIDNKLHAAFKAEALTKTPDGITTTTFAPSRSQGMSARLTRFDALFTAPSDSLSEDQPLFPGLNDQGGLA